MGLKDLQIPRDEVRVPGGGSFAIRGLSLVDLRGLLMKHADSMQRVFDMFVLGKGPNVSVEDAAASATAVIDAAPALVADAIATAADEPDAVENALMLPFPVQLDALMKLGKLTFTSEEDVKKFLQAARAIFVKMGSKPSA